jgi:glucosyl-dolichyl phosphate glucuronosyltransferase
VKVTIGIPTHNRARLLERALASLANLRIPNDCSPEVLVVADACDNDTAKVAAAARLPIPLKVIEAKLRNLNRGRNLCFEHGHGEIVLFLDDDVEVSPDLLTGHVGTFRDTPASMTAGQVLLAWSEGSQPSWMSDHTARLLTERRDGDTVRRLEHEWDAVGANFAVHRRVVEKIGGFLPGLDRSGIQLLTAGETELLRRALRAGFELWSAPTALVHHHVAIERISDTRYVYGVARGLGMSHIFMRDGLGAVEVARQLVGRTARCMWHGARYFGASLAGDQRVAVERMCDCQIDRGALEALLLRMSGRSPVTLDPPRLDLV